ncbi:unnamed protein product, partial [Choristocarpus tenellus]
EVRCFGELGVRRTYCSPYDKCAIYLGRSTDMPGSQYSQEVEVVSDPQNFQRIDDSARSRPRTTPRRTSGRNCGRSAGRRSSRREHVRFQSSTRDRSHPRSRSWDRHSNRDEQRTREERRGHTRSPGCHHRTRDPSPNRSVSTRLSRRNSLST